MNNTEFSQRFDTLVQVHKSKFRLSDDSLLEFDEYEKSVYLTKAQNLIVNELAEQFESSEVVRRKLAVLVKTFTTSTQVVSSNKLSPQSILIQVPDDLLKIIHESVVIGSSQACYNGNTINILPMTHDDYSLQASNPFRKPKLTGLENTAWRLDTGETLESVEIILPDTATFTSYTMRYVKNPVPIVLVDLGDISIEGVNTATECELDSFQVQESILDLAVNLALSAISKFGKKE